MYGYKPVDISLVVRQVHTQSLIHSFIHSFDQTSHSFDMKSTFFALAAATAAGSAFAQGAVYSQCGGQGWTGATTCVSGTSCQKQNDWYFQCVPGAAAPAKASAASVKTSAASVKTSAAPVKASTSTKQASKSTARPVSTSTSKAAASSPAAVARPAASSSSTSGSSSGKVSYAGVNVRKSIPLSPRSLQVTNSRIDRWP